MPRGTLEGKEILKARSCSPRSGESSLRAELESLLRQPRHAWGIDILHSGRLGKGGS